MLIDITKLEKVKKNVNGITARCPFCAKFGNDRAGNHLSVLNTGVFSCVVAPGDSEHNKGILSLVGNTSETNYIIPQIEEKVEIERIYDENIISRLIKDYTYFNQRNIPNEIMAKYDCGLAGEGQQNGRFVFICRNIKGEIIGFAGRSVLGREPKWKIMGAKSKFIFPSKSLSYEFIKESGKVILVESVPCVLSLAKIGLNNTICLFGTSLSQSIMQYLIALSPKSIIISTNLDKTNIGQEAAKKIQLKLSRLFNSDIISIKLPFKKDFNEMSDDELLKWRGEIDNG